MSCWVCLFLSCGWLMRSCVSAQGEWRHLTQDLSPHTQDLSPPTEDLSPHTQELSPHTQDLSPHTQDLSPHTQDLCHPPHRICVTSRTRSVSLHTQGLCHLTRMICVTSHTRSASPHTQDVRHNTGRICVTYTQDGNKLRPSLLPPKRECRREMSTVELVECCFTSTETVGLLGTMTATSTFTQLLSSDVNGCISSEVVPVVWVTLSTCYNVARQTGRL